MQSLLALGRVYNLPTVWSNCLAGWWLAGGGSELRLAGVFLGATFLYLGSVFLNDAFDADYDRLRHPLRPIPSGILEAREVLRWGLGWLALGVACVAGISTTTVLLALSLAVTLILYNAIHKVVALAPLLMAGCRMLLYLLAASAASAGISGVSVWSGLALGIYVLGIGFIANMESSRRRSSQWPLILLTGPPIMAFLLDDGRFLWMAVVLSALLSVWILWTLQHAFWQANRNIRYTVSLLVAGITLADWLALCDLHNLPGYVFVLAFVLTLILQRQFHAT